MKLTVVPIFIGALRTVSKGFAKKIERIRNSGINLTHRDESMIKVG